MIMKTSTLITYLLFGGIAYLLYQEMMKKKDTSNVVTVQDGDVIKVVPPPGSANDPASADYIN